MIPALVRKLGSGLAGRSSSVLVRARRSTSANWMTRRFEYLKPFLNHVRPRAAVVPSRDQTCRKSVST